MKLHFIIPFTLTLLFALEGSAQKNHLMGPAAKNYKPWKNLLNSGTILVKSQKSETGPAAKNRKHWLNDTQMYPIVFVDLKELQGPDAKNTPLNTYRKVKGTEAR